MTTTKRITLEGHVVEVLIATGHTSWQPRGTEVRNSRQVTILSEEELREIAAGPDIPSPEAGWQGANLVQAGIPHLSQLPPGIRLCFPDGTTLAVESENHPCIVPDRLIQPRHPDGPDISKRFLKVAAGGSWPGSSAQVGSGPAIPCGPRSRRGGCT